MKRCTFCGDEKPLTEFYKMSIAKDGLRPECKDCNRLRYLRTRDRWLAKSRLWHKTHKEAHNAINRRWLERQKQK